MTRLSACVLVVLLATSCAHQQSQQPEATARREGQSAVGVLWWPASPSDPRHEAVLSAEACIRQGLEIDASEFRVERYGAIRDALFPLFETSTQPQSENELLALLGRPVVRARLLGIGLRYLVVVGGSKQADAPRGGLICDSSAGVPGCLGFAWQSEQSELHAILWDLSTQAVVGRPSAQAAGTSFVPAYVVPIPVYAHSWEEACVVLGARIAQAVKAQASGER